MALRRKKTDRRGRIIAAALKLYCEEGVAATSLTAIAQKARVPRPLIHYYFPNPELLFEAAVASLLDELRSAYLSDLERELENPRRALKSYIERHFDWLVARPEIAPVWLHFYQLASFRPAFRAMNDSIRSAGRERIAAILYRGVEKGHFKLPPATAVPEAALALQGFITGAVVMALTEGFAKASALRANLVQFSLLWAGAKID